MNQLFQDIRYGFRSLLNHPGFAAVAVITLALGIGANSAIFSVVNAVVLQPLSYAEPERLGMVWETIAGDDRRSGAPGNYFDWRGQNPPFHDMAPPLSPKFNPPGDGEDSGYHRAP